ncbi:MULTISPECIES: RelA/SpoT family protein [Methylomonas]|uniref:RelA/SpoT family protein n=1 Tax=Methylomonas TaxID=416 RepID=UPI0012327D68|nr:bifunctional (p)ppGpp synthetase/guanosine-3',5'-bis(diphosphate) 3'-pyrophosphohydrolase [Methylomonas rhizoryzae]
MVEIAHALPPLPDVEHPEEKLLHQLCEVLSAYLDQDAVANIVRAYRFGAKAHSGQFRKSGEAYICHPVSVAISLAGMHMDANGIMAAILHDVIEDTPVSKAELTEQFGSEVADLVDGVTKLSKIDSRSRAEAQAENVRKMFLAMAQDLRVIVVKLADRLHNMQTLGNMPADKKRRIAKETLEIYAPIANRLGMNDIRHQLETLGFKALYPNRFVVLSDAVKKSRGNRKEIIDTIQNAIQNRLTETGMDCSVAGREKNIASIYHKMVSKKISFSDVFDVYAFRIYCHQVDDCYRALGCVHNLFKPIPGRFKDYIALPKANGYQSLHTILKGPYGVPIEIQIRTHEMHRLSESGIAAHWLYKSDHEKSETMQARANEWLRELLEIQKSAGDSLEFIDNLKVDLFPQEVFVFSPKGKIIKLPRGATVVDFAYQVHTDVGNACISARIDKKLVPLQTKLENGMTVEVITAPWARPNPLWLNYVVTAKARSCIRSYLKNFNQQEAINLGRRLLEKELNSSNITLDEVDDTQIMQVLHSLRKHSLNDLLEDIGLGNRMPFLVAKHICQIGSNTGVKLDGHEPRNKSPLIIKGTEGMVVSLAKCCRPIPGDPIIGFFNPGKGIVVHHHECRNSNEVRKKQTTWLDVEWSPEASGEFSAEIRVEILNQRGSLATVASTISFMESNIENITVVSQDDRVSVDLLTLAVRDRVHLANIIRKLKKLSIVLKITRIKA